MSKYLLEHFELEDKNTTMPTQPGNVQLN